MMVWATLRRAKLSQIRCPTCGAIGRCSNAGRYRRMMITIANGERSEVEMAVPRVRCESCKRTHSLLADVLIPNGSYTLRFVLHVLCAYLHRTEPVARLCEHWAISVSTLYGWIHLFSEQYNLWARIFEQISWVMEAALEKVGDISGFPAQFFRRFQFCFMQRPPTTRSHPRGRGGGLYFCPVHNSEIDL